MAYVAKFVTVPLQVLDTPENMDRIAALAEKCQISKAEVVRRAMHGKGLTWLERQAEAGKVQP